MVAIKRNTNTKTIIELLEKCHKIKETKDKISKIKKEIKSAQKELLSINISKSKKIELEEVIQKLQQKKEKTKTKLKNINL